MAEMKNLPFLFTYRDSVFGQGFWAEVVAHGRVLAAREGDVWWLYGVQPGDVTAQGETPAEAQAEFRKEFTAVLYDIANEVKDFAEFKAHVEQFMQQPNEPVRDVWVRAVQQVRQSGLARTTTCRVESADTPV